jgi:hypothetical protein
VNGYVRQTIASLRRRIVEVARATSSLDPDWTFNTVMQRRTNLCGIGACFVAAAILPSGEGTVAHVGDCRASVISPRGVRHLTIDHTLATEVALGREKTNHPSADRIVTRALGFNESPPQCDTSRFHLDLDESLILASSLARVAVSDGSLKLSREVRHPRALAAHVLKSISQNTPGAVIVIARGIADDTNQVAE